MVPPVLFEPLGPTETLAVLVPPPRFHLVRYNGLLAPMASWRDEVVQARALCVGTGKGMRILTAGQTPDAIRSILECLDLPARPPLLTPALPSTFTQADA